jgi:hypothetical protein
LQSYDDYISDFKSAYKAMKEGDMTRYRSVIQRARSFKRKVRNSAANSIQKKSSDSPTI